MHTHKCISKITNTTRKHYTYNYLALSLYIYTHIYTYTYVKLGIRKLGPQHRCLSRRPQQYSGRSGWWIPIGADVSIKVTHRTRDAVGPQQLPRHFGRHLPSIAIVLSTPHCWGFNTYQHDGPIFQLHCFLCAYTYTHRYLPLSLSHSCLNYD